MEKTFLYVIKLKGTWYNKGDGIRGKIELDKDIQRLRGCYEVKHNSTKKGEEEEEIKMRHKP